MFMNTPGDASGRPWCCKHQTSPHLGVLPSTSGAWCRRLPTTSGRREGVGTCGLNLSSQGTSSELYMGKHAQRAAHLQCSLHLGGDAAGFVAQHVYSHGGTLLAGLDQPGEPAAHAAQRSDWHADGPQRGHAGQGQLRSPAAGAAQPLPCTGSSRPDSTLLAEQVADVLMACMWVLWHARGRLASAVTLLPCSTKTAHAPVTHACNVMRLDLCCEPLVLQHVPRSLACAGRECGGRGQASRWPGEGRAGSTQPS